MGDAEEDAFLDEDPWDETLAEINLDLNGVAPKPPLPSSSGHTYTYKDVPIQFPYQAYKSQHQMMEKIIEGVTTGENCLLESPTGTGKTAALLCSLLGWQRDCYKRKDNCFSVIEAAVERMGGCTCGFIKDKKRTRVLLKPKKNELFLTAYTTYIEEVPEETSIEDEEATQKVVTPEKCAKSESVSPTQSQDKKNELPSTSCCSDTPVKCHPSISTISKTKESIPSPRKRKRTETESVEEETRHVDKVCASCVRLHVVDKSRPPRIYYCTRTHSQITQVIKQLKGTAYNDAKMTILASRAPTCIHDQILQAVNDDDTMSSQQDIGEAKQTVDDICRTLKKNYLKNKRALEKNPDMETEWHCPDFQQMQNTEEERERQKMLPVCKFFRQQTELASAFSEFHGKGAWDLEDIRQEGIKCDRCPYYGTKALHKSSDIVFGSYNYLLQPSIRENANIKYINSVLVFDEAHNIEDICRSVYSVSVTVEDLDQFRLMIDNLIVHASNPQSYAKPRTLRGLQSVSVKLKQWSDQITDWGNQEKEKKYKDDKHQVKIQDIKIPYESNKLHEALTEMNLTADSVSACILLLGGEKEEDPTVASHDDEDEEYYFDSRGRKRTLRVPSKVTEYLKKIRQSLKYLFAEEIEGIGGSKDFKGYLVGVANPTRKLRSYMNNDSRRSRVQARQSETQLGPEYFYKLEIICLNPAIGFRRLRNTAYSIIVASGTLTPLDSFSSELATKFAVRLQADHVIPTSNVWAGVITTGPSNKTLMLNKAQQGDEVIQDDLGRIILDICKTVPNGVLVFFPSYTLMHQLENRWRNYPVGNSILHQITRIKKFFTEESKDKNAFKLNMQRYKEDVKGGYNWNGCVLFAVFRGKISEGIDFADEQARAVVTIGIPYSNAVAAEIVSKKAYNNMRNKTQKPGENFLSGSEWYTTQAFRAMNQGFGRCVRHCDDWGALVLIDSRLAFNRQDRFISGWVKKNLKSYKSFDEVKSALDRFMNEMKFKKPKKIQIEYEQDDLENTELVAVGSFCEMDSQDDQMLTQVAFAFEDNNVHNLTTQVCRTSTPLRQTEREVETVGESSPEYSFTEETQEVLGLGSLPSPIAPVNDVNPSTDANQSRDNDSDSSVSVYERTPEEIAGGDNNDDGNESDKEFFAMVDMLESSADDQQRSQNQQQQDEQNQSEVFDVSMPSVQNSENEMSQMSDISYHSDWDRSVS